MHLRFLTNVPLLLLLASVAAFAQKPELVLQTGHSSMVSTVRFSPDGRFLASSGEDGAVVLWDPANGRVLRRFTDHGKWVLGLDISADGHTVCSAARAESPSRA